MKPDRRWTGAGVIAVLLVLLMALPRLTLAGGVAILLDEPPRNVQANVAFTIGFTIRSAHEGRMLQPDLQPVLIASKVGSKEQITAEATEEGDLGHYVATLTLPAAGAWQWEMLPFSPDDTTYRLSLPGPLEVLAEGAAAPSGQPADNAMIQDAKMIDNTYAPLDVTVAAGTTIVWHNLGKLPHTVTAANDLFSSGNLEPGAEWSYTFTEPGTYSYYCQYHAAKPVRLGDEVLQVEVPGGGGNMIGTIVVTAPVAGGASQAGADTDADAPPAPTTPILAQVAVQSGAATTAEAPSLPRTGNPDVPYVLVGLVALLAAGAGLVFRRRSGA